MKQKDVVYAFLDVIRELDGQGLSVSDESKVITKLFDITDRPTQMGWLLEDLQNWLVQKDED